MLGSFSVGVRFTWWGCARGVFLFGGCAAPFGGCERPSRFGSLLVRVVKSGRTERSSASKSGSTGNELFGATTSRFCSRRVAFGLVFKVELGQRL